MNPFFVSSGPEDPGDPDRPGRPRPDPAEGTGTADPADRPDRRPRLTGEDPAGDRLRRLRPDGDRRPGPGEGVLASAMRYRPEGQQIPSGGTLLIQLKKKHRNNVGKVLFTVSAPLLNTLDLSGAATFSAKTVKPEADFDLDMSGASKAEIKQLTLNGHLDLDASGASKLRLGSVSCARLDIDLTGGAFAHSKLDGKDLKYARFYLADANGHLVNPAGKLIVKYDGGDTNVKACGNDEEGYYIYLGGNPIATLDKSKISVQLKTPNAYKLYKVVGVFSTAMTEMMPNDGTTPLARTFL